MNYFLIVWHIRVKCFTEQILGISFLSHHNSEKYLEQTENNMHFSSTYTHTTLHFYSCLYLEGFYRGICLYIIFLIIYNIYSPKNCEKNASFKALYLFVSIDLNDNTYFKGHFL